jgi:hypothetical protein
VNSLTSNNILVSTQNSAYKIMSFNEALCHFESNVWCGEGSKKGKKKGTSLECLKKGFGAGASRERKKLLPATSLQQIDYVGEKYEKNFIKNGIKTTTQFRAFAAKSTAAKISEKLKKIFVKKGGGIYVRGYNQALLWLYRHGIGKLPSCRKDTG